MSSHSSPIPNEIYLKILNYVMQSSNPVRTLMFVRLAYLSRKVRPKNTLLPSTAGTPSKLFRIEPCTQPLCDWFTSVQGQSRCLCSIKQLRKTHQAEHLKDWVLANGVSHRFRNLAAEVFFTNKLFVITPEILDQVRSYETTFITTRTMRTNHSTFASMQRCQCLAYLATLSAIQSPPCLGHLAGYISE